MISGTCHYSGFPQQFIHPSWDWMQTLKAPLYSCFSWLLLSETIPFAVWWYNHWSSPPRDWFSHGSWECILRTCQISKFHGHLCKVQALSLFRQQDQLSPPPPPPPPHPLETWTPCKRIRIHKYEILVTPGLYWNMHTMDMLWENFQRTLPLYVKPINLQANASVVSSVTTTVFIDICLPALGQRVPRIWFG